MDFNIAADAVSQSAIPQKKLNSGFNIPAIGLGTFGSDKFTPDMVAAAVLDAISLGYRHIDCASVYGNEKEIGEALNIVLASAKIDRSELFITSKVWNDMHGKGDILLSCAQSLSDLGLDYLDLYLVHWPFPNFHPIGCSVDSRSPNSRPYIHEEYMAVWRKMEKLVDMGLVRSIGTSNVTIPKLELILRDAIIRPAVNEMELHPHFQQKELFDFVIANGIQPIGYCPVGSPNRPERDKTADDTVDLDDPVIVEIAKKHGVHPAIICLKWSHQLGAIPIPFSVKRANYMSNLLSITTDLLSEDEMRAIDGIDRNCRLIKGQVFLWEGTDDWQDLWDLDGTITGWSK